MCVCVCMLSVTQFSINVVCRCVGEVKMAAPNFLARIGAKIESWTKLVEWAVSCLPPMFHRLVHLFVVMFDPLDNKRRKKLITGLLIKMLTNFKIKSSEVLLESQPKFNYALQRLTHPFPHPPFF